MRLRKLFDTNTLRGAFGAGVLLGGLWMLALGVSLRWQPTPPEAEPRTLGDHQPASDSVLLFPVPDGSRELLEGGFREQRGDRRHQAVDIPAPRGSQVLAVSDGTLERLSNSELGGVGLYLRGASGDRCYYYAHLARYAPELADGQPLTRGQLLGYVGTTGNAPPTAPHLHLAVHSVGAEQSCSEGEPVDPYPLLSGGPLVAAARD